jgi:hypothetical protein
VAKLKTDKRKAVDIKGAKKSLQDDRLADPLTEKLRQQRYPHYDLQIFVIVMTQLLDA